MLITMKQATNIRNCMKQGMDISEVAKGYGISEERVNAICGTVVKKKRKAKKADPD